MRELERRQKFKKRMYSMPVLAILLVVTVALGKGAFTLLAKERESARDAELLSAKVENLTARDAELKAEIDKLHTGDGIEEVIKSKYNVAKEGEHVAVIVDKPGGEASTTPQGEPWWKGVWNAIIAR